MHFVLTCQGREEALVMSQIEEELRQEELRRAQAALLEKQQKNDKKKENEEFLDRLVINCQDFSSYSLVNRDFKQTTTTTATQMG